MSETPQPSVQTSAQSSVPADIPKSSIPPNKKGKSYIFPILLICIAFFLYYILFMRRTFIRSEERFPFFWNPVLNKTLKKYVSILPSRYIVFLTGPYKSGKSRTLYNLTNDLIQKEGRLVLNFDFDSFNSTESLIKHAKIAIQNGLIELRPYINSHVLKEVQPSSFGTSLNIPPGLDILLSGVYGNLVKPIDLLFNSINNSDNQPDALHQYQTRAVWEFFKELNSYSNNLRPVIFIHGGDNLLHPTGDKPINNNSSYSPLFEILRADLSRRNQYTNYIPIVIELHDSSLLPSFDDNPSIVEEFGSMNSIRVVTTDGEINETASDILIRSRLFTSYEIRKMQKEIGKHGGSYAHILEGLKFGDKIENSIDIEKKMIDSEVKELLHLSQLNSSYSSEQRRNRLIQKICKGKGDLFLSSRDDILLLKPLFQYGYLYNDEEMNTHVANKAVLRSICSSR